MTDSTVNVDAPLPNADLTEILGTVLSSVTNNRRQVLARHEELVLETKQNELIQKQFDAMIHSLNLLLADPTALQAVADKLAADEAAKNAPPVEVPTDTQPAAGASDSEGSAAPAAEVPAGAGNVGTDANGSPVADDASAAS